MNVRMPPRKPSKLICCILLYQEHDELEGDKICSLWGQSLRVIWSEWDLFALGTISASNLVRMGRSGQNSLPILYLLFFFFLSRSILSGKIRSSHCGKQSCEVDRKS
ncbi:hypothetical protein CEXT_565731 [Caerostris extrusa]|uniref:Uncharacterized protein n=1 Tax=Caerostris extrusa TaxID=172846 RepID=A0AAV4QH31_CAEEX|nr:hypothetical protein CEXT_565731 [Caerostris extrusa]